MTPDQSLLTVAGAPDPTVLPRFVDRKTAAKLIRRHYFPIAAKTLERCPLPTRRVGGRALFETSALLRWAEARMAAVPVMANGRRRLDPTPAPADAA